MQGKKSCWVFFLLLALIQMRVFFLNYIINSRVWYLQAWIVRKICGCVVRTAHPVAQMFSVISEKKSHESARQEARGPLNAVPSCNNTERNSVFSLDRRPRSVKSLTLLNVILSKGALNIDQARRWSISQDSDVLLGARQPQSNTGRIVMDPDWDRWRKYCCPPGLNITHCFQLHHVPLSIGELVSSC